jgi:hypothetical protein
VRVRRVDGRSTDVVVDPDAASVHRVVMTLRDRARFQLLGDSLGEGASAGDRVALGAGQDAALELLGR